MAVMSTVAAAAAAIKEDRRWVDIGLQFIHYPAQFKTPLDRHLLGAYITKPDQTKKHQDHTNIYIFSKDDSIQLQLHVPFTSYANFYDFHTPFPILSIKIQCIRGAFRPNINFNPTTGKYNITAWTSPPELIHPKDHATSHFTIQFEHKIFKYWQLPPPRKPIKLPIPSAFSVASPENSTITLCQPTTTSTVYVITLKESFMHNNQRIKTVMVLRLDHKKHQFFPCVAWSPNSRGLKFFCIDTNIGGSLLIYTTATTPHLNITCHGPPNAFSSPPDHTIRHH